MKALNEILKSVKIIQIKGDADKYVSKICLSTDSVIKDCLFVAIKGNNTDGHNYIDKAISLGASVILCENLPKDINYKTTYVLIKDTRDSLGICSANFFNKPSEKIKLVGITGTNGKTSIATLLYNLFNSLKIKSGLISTIHNIIDEEILPSKLTTPNPIEINFLLKKMVDRNCEYCFMEVSSHGISQKRISGLNFVCGVFSNLSRDHLDYHKNFEEYILTKKKFFDSFSENSLAIINNDDPYCQTMIKDCDSKKIFYGLSKESNYFGEVINSTLNGIKMKINNLIIDTKIAGQFNVYNLLATFSVASELTNYPIHLNMSLLKKVPGRFNIINSHKGVIGIIDYAHSPDALEKIFETINSLRERKQKIITVLGCGGNRDVGKRPIMGEISYCNSDISIFTSDNPRYEKIEKIIIDMQSNIKEEENRKLICIHDRYEAIKKASDLAQRDDIILILGKGHEDYQEISGEKKPFDDFKVLTKILK